jgi:hypothetical protein
LSGAEHKPAFIVWVDAVGGFLICPSAAVVVGQAVAAGEIDIPIFGDLSRKHALIARHGEGYTIEPIGEGEVRVGEKSGRSFLAAGDPITLGAEVRLDFARPHPLSASAVLSLASHHRTEPRVDAIILMAESCVMGPKTSNHIVCPDWPTDIVLFGQGETIHCRSSAPLEVDGQVVGNRGELTLASRVVSEDLSFTLEPV